MGFEKIIEIKKADANLSSILLAHLKAIPNTTTLSVSKKEGGAEILLRFSGRELREHWPEDITINLSDKEIYLCFHSGNRKTQEKIVNDLITFLEQLSVSFTEIEN